ncbi:MAG: hypothetical protein M0R51_12090 [Clostridia bacterium]|jgi:hypothetical protein|nr:hypothetical protein [Clostridia bacterium]
MEQTVIALDLIDVSAKPDSTLTSTDKQPFVDLTQLKSDSLSVPKYATLEDNFFLLDGTFEPFPETPESEDMGYWSSSQSDENGEFTTNPMLEIDFTENHTSAGLTLTFLEDYPLEINVKWYTLAGVKISEKTFEPDALYYFCDNQIEDFGKITIEFIRTKPYRYIKLEKIDYGVYREFSEDEITATSITEEVNPISSEITINTAKFSLHSDNGDYDLTGLHGVYKLFQQTQKVHLIQKFDTEEKQMGTFYLDTWKSPNEYNAEFTAVDAVGLIDKTDFKLGQIYTNETAENIIDAIMASAGITDYTIEDDLKSVTLSGWIPICTHREALQHVAFALGAIVDDSRGNTIKIYKGAQSYGRVIPRSRKFSGGSTTLLTYVSDVNLTAHNYALKDDSEQISTGTYAIGTYEIHFDTAVFDLAATGATITESYPNYCIITVGTAGKVTLTGYKYEDNSSVYNYGVANLPSGAGKNSISCKDATLISLSNVAEIAQELFIYYQLRYETSVEIALENELSGEKVAVQRASGTAYTMEAIEKMDIDLVGGFTAKITTLGNGINILSADYLNEKYIGEDLGVI